MAGNGRGSSNVLRQQLKTAGHHEQLTLRAVANLQNQLHHARENLHPNKLRKLDKSLEKIEQGLQVVGRALQRSSGQWQRAARVDFAVREGVRAVSTPQLTPELVSETLHQYAEGESSGDTALPVQDLTVRDATSSIRGGREVRLRTFNLDGHVIKEPANGEWYQTSEAVGILYELKQTGARVLNKVITRWLEHTPPQIGMKRAILMRKVQHVEKAVANGFSVDDAIQGLVTDRPAMNEVPCAGAKPVMRSDEFVSALKPGIILHVSGV